jgi:hypothetical protein
VVRKNVNPKISEHVISVIAEKKFREEEIPGKISEHVISVRPEKKFR